MPERDDESVLREAIRRLLFVAPIVVLIVVIVYGMTHHGTLGN